MSAILWIPAEINERILTMSEPRAVAAMAQSCSFFRDLIHRPIDQHLWRSLFLAQFDNPRITLETLGRDSVQYPWAPELQRRIHSETLLTNGPGFDLRRPEERCMALQTLADAITNSPPPYLLTSPSQDIHWVRRLVEAAGIFTDSEHLQSAGQDETEKQLLAQLHAYYGLTTAEKQLPHAQAMRTASRCFVYDLRKYSRANLWGPFKRGGRVNWIHMEHIINVISMNLEEIEEQRDEFRPPVGLEAARPYSAPGTDKRSERDWAGVEGKWYRYVCFMDYRDLFAFNFSLSTDSDTDTLNPWIFEDDDFQEAIRLIELNLHITSINPSASQPEYPIIKFGGSSKGAQNNEARIEGSVRMTPDGQVRWKFVSVYDGEPQWSSEGIQIGGIGSAMGIVGNWTGAFHSDRDPVGPFWLWKVKNGGCVS